MVTSAMNVKVCGNDKGGCGISLDGSWQRRGQGSVERIRFRGQMTSTDFILVAIMQRLFFLLTEQDIVWRH